MTTYMDLEDALLSEISQTEKGKYHMILLMCGILKKKKKAPRYREETGGCQRQPEGSEGQVK